MPKCPVHHIAFPEGQKCSLCMVTTRENREATIKHSPSALQRHLPTIVTVAIVSVVILAGFLVTSGWPKVKEGLGGDIEYFESLCKKDAGEVIKEHIDEVSSIAQLQPPASCPERAAHSKITDVPKWVLMCSDNWLADRPSNLGLLSTSHYSVFETRLSTGENGVTERTATYKTPEYGSSSEKFEFAYSDTEKDQISSRYGYSWKFFRTEVYPERIAGIQIDIFDSQEKRVIASRRDYVLYRQDRKPARICENPHTWGDPVHAPRFIQRVLRPPFHAYIARVFTPEIRANKELFEGVKSFYTHDNPETIRLLTPLAESGNPEAAIYLGLTLRANRGRLANGHPGAVKLFKAAADAGHPLGMHLYSEERFRSNKEEGLAYLKRAAENGWVESIRLISFYHRLGDHGIERDYVKALAWLLIIKEHPEKIRRDSTNLETELELMDREVRNISTGLSEEQIKDATKMAKEWTVGHSV